MSLDLDARQRAMLAEMHVPVWWPEAAPPAASLAVDAQVAAVAMVVAATPVTVITPALPAIPAPRGAPKSLAQAMADAPELAGAVGLGQAGSAPTPVVARRASTTAIEAMDWPTLQASVAGCVACPLCQSRKNTVFGVGPTPLAEGQPPQADWLIVGEAPGENEDLQGEPFVGQAGKLLDNMLKAIGVSRHGSPEGEPPPSPRQAACIVNVLKCRPPGNRNPTPEEVAECEPYLRRQVALLQPKVIIAMGRFAVQSLLAETVPGVQATPLGRLRGQVHQYQGVPVVVSYHPAYLLRSLPEKAKAWADLCLAMDVWQKRSAAETQAAPENPLAT